ncbi:hypothetical protein PMIN06_011388 [Paraphaeosphaeria minitans]
MGVNYKGEGAEVIDGTEDTKNPDGDEDEDKEGFADTEFPDDDDPADNDVPSSRPPDPMVDAGAGCTRPVPSTTTLCV